MFNDFFRRFKSASFEQRLRCSPTISSSNNTPFLFAAHPRCNKFDTALESPAWDAEFIQQQQLQEDSALFLDLDLQQQQEDGGTVNMNDVLPGSQTYGSASHQQSMNEFTFGGSSNSNSSSRVTGVSWAGSSPPTPLSSDNQNPIRRGLHILNSLVQKRKRLHLSHTIISRRLRPTFPRIIIRMGMGIIIHWQHK